MRTVTAVVIGGGHCGLAMSRCLTDRSIDHVVLERGEVANSWRTERWDSLRLLTPNWQSRLPGGAYEGPEPDGFMTMPEVVALLDRYAEAVSAPVLTGTTVTASRPTEGGFEVVTDQGDWRCRAVVLATGACSLADLPALAGQLPPSLTMLAANAYRSPDLLPDGGVLVVGASATGVQLAEEIHRSGRPVTLAVGEHVRVPRTYRGRDVMWWMDASGLMDERYDEVDDVARARRVPSFQLVGTPERATIDLNALSGTGVQLVGRLVAGRDQKALFSGSLPNVCALADLKLSRLLATFDERAAERGFDNGVEPPERFAPTRLEASPPLEIDLVDRGIRTVIWATGFRPDWSWLDVPVLDRKGHVRHDGGVVAWPGLYLMGMPFLRRRKSSLIDGAGDDARDLSDHLAAHLAGRTTPS